MVSRTVRKQRKQAWDNLQKRFVKAKRRNLLAKPGPRKVVIILDSLKPTFNIGKIFRSADAFGALEVHLVGIDVFDPAPSKGSFHHVPAIFHNNFANCHQRLSDEGYTFFIFSPHGGKPLPEAILPERSVFVFGHEEFGFSFDPSEFQDIIPVYIPQVGKVESLNVSIAASIALYEYTRLHPINEKITSTNEQTQHEPISG